MSGKRAKWLRKQLMDGNPAIFLSIRKWTGARTEGMSPLAIYRNAKRLWNQGKIDMDLMKLGNEPLE